MLDKGTYCLAQRSALPNGNLITFLHTECRRYMGSQVLMSLLISRILGNKMEVFPSYDESSMHFSRDDSASKYSTAD